jgi:hypothetical protein
VTVTWSGWRALATRPRSSCSSSRLQDPDRFGAWLGGIVANVSRAARRAPLLLLLADWPEALHPASSVGLPSAEDLNRAHARRAAVADLPDGQRQASSCIATPIYRPGTPTARPARPGPACTKPGTGCASTSPSSAPISSPPSPGGQPRPLSASRPSSRSLTSRRTDGLPPRDVADRAELWLHIVTQDRRQGLEEHGPALAGGRDWAVQEIAAQIPENAELIRFGLTLTGPGQVALRSTELTRT